MRANTLPVFVQVRNAACGIVQLEYGDDNLDPVSMEGKDGSPIDFVRSLALVKACTPPDEVAPGRHTLLQPGTTWLSRTKS